MKSTISLLIYFFLIFSGCKETETYEFNDKLYLLNKVDYEARCITGRIEKSILYPTKFEISIFSFEKKEIKNKILKTPLKKWLSLLQSKNIKLSISASIWLYFLTEQKVEFLKLRGVEQGKVQREQVLFWKTYFRDKGLEFDELTHRLVTKKNAAMNL